ncbi:unnamed protein product [Oncorhynchus mykiss]|uniref:Uncharacterized protein n=1 Tax=Oncorhynchus mykiss TaxID=8022 RepID=A0A060XAC4_ONCMY|nr:unnamed protein product [Oncorhynchus mykiss]
MSHRHRTRGAGANRSRKGDKEQNMLGQGRSGSSQTFLTSVGMPCPANSVIYLSSKFLQERGGRHEGPGDVGPPNTERTRYLVLASNREPHGGQPRTTLRNSAGEYNYPATPQDSPDRRRVVSAPSTQMDFGEPPRWTHEGLNYNSKNGAPYPSQRPGLIRANHHGLADFSHLMGKSVGEPTPSGQ